MAVRLALPDADARRRPAARTRPARGLQRPVLGSQDGGPVAYDAQRPAALAHGVSAVAALAQGQGVRGNGPRPAGTVASGWGKERAAFGGGS